MKHYNHVPVFLLAPQKCLIETVRHFHKARKFNIFARKQNFRNNIKIKWYAVCMSHTSDDAYDEFLRLFLNAYSKSFPYTIHKKVKKRASPGGMP